MSPLAAVYGATENDFKKAPAGPLVNVLENRIADQLITQIDADFAMLPVDGLGLEYRAAHRLKYSAGIAVSLPAADR